MTVTLREQISLFAFCILCGAAVAVVFDLFRISRRLVRTSVWLTALEDVFFCILMAAMVFFVGLMCNDGEFRWYMLAGTLLGALMYFKTLSRAVRGVLVWLLEWINKIAVLLLRIALYPVRLLVRLVNRPVIMALNFGRRGVRRTCGKMQGSITVFRKFFMPRRRKKRKNP